MDVRPTGVTAVFKRFFGGRYCELQVLFDAEAGRQLYAAYAASGFDPDQGLPWELLRRVANLLLLRPTGAEEGGGVEETSAVPQLAKPVFEDVVALRAALRDDGSGGAAGAGLFEIEINLANWTAAELPAGTPATLARPPQLGPVVVLAGDAAVTAHYRLGVGVNHAYSSLADFSRMLARVLVLVAGSPGQTADAAAAADIRAAVAEYARTAGQRCGTPTPAGAPPAAASC